MKSGLMTREFVLEALQRPAEWDRAENDSAYLAVVFRHKRIRDLYVYISESYANQFDAHAKFRGCWFEVYGRSNRWFRKHQNMILKHLDYEEAVKSLQPRTRRKR